MRISDERLADLEYHARLYNNNLALTGKDALDLIADLRDARALARDYTAQHDEGAREQARFLQGFAFDEREAGRICCGCEICQSAAAYFDAPETKREGAQ